MKVVGLYRFALIPGVDAHSFEKFMSDEVFTDDCGLQLTRITKSFGHRLFASGDSRPGTQYVWQVTVDLVTDSGYDFEQNASAIQDRLANLAVLIAIESYSPVQS